MEELVEEASEREEATETPILFQSNPPKSQMPFTAKSKLVKEELVARAWERELAPESTILFSLKSKLVMEELVAKA